jgi:protein TonB
MPHFVLRPPEQPPLVIDLQGIVEEDQVEQKVVEQVKGTTEPQETVDKPVEDKPPPDPPPPDKPQESLDPVVALPPPMRPQVVRPGTDQQNVVGANENQVAHTVRTQEEEDDELSEYVRVLSKKVRANLVYPQNGRSASAVVAFTILTDGTIRPGSLKIAETSGQPRLDESALQTIRASAPFPRPSKELSVAIIVDFERKR